MALDSSNCQIYTTIKNQNEFNKVFNREKKKDPGLTRGKLFGAMMEAFNRYMKQGVSDE